MAAPPLQIKDANQVVQPMSAAADSSGNIAVMHVAATVDAVTGVAAAVSTAKPLPVINAAGSVAVDGSGTITTGGQAQVMFGNTTPTNGYLVANNSAGTMYVSDVGTATNGGNSIPIAPGAIFQTPDGYKPPGPVSIFGSVTSAAFAARRW